MTQIISVTVFESKRGKTAPIQTDKVCMRQSAIDPKIKIASLLSLDENIVTNINV